MKIHPFIFNWPGQFKKPFKKPRYCSINSNVQFLEKQLSHYNNLTIINSSDDKNEKKNWHNIGSTAYFGKQFMKSLELFHGDILLHIQGDASYANWDAIIEKALYFFKTYDCGIYAPNVNYTFWDETRVLIDKFPNEHKVFNVTNTDCTVWFIHSSIVLNLRQEFDRQIRRNRLGWGIPFLASAISSIHQKPVLRDYNFTVFHPKRTTYNTAKASSLRDEMIVKIGESSEVLGQMIKSLYDFKQKINYGDYIKYDFIK